MIIVSSIIIAVLLFIIVIVSTIMRKRAEARAAFDTERSTARTKKRKLIIKKKKKTDQDYKDLGVSPEELEQADNLGDSIVDANSTNSTNGNDSKNKKDNNKLKGMLTDILKEEAIALGIETGLTAAEKALKNLRSA